MLVAEALRPTTPLAAATKALVDLATRGRLSFPTVSAVVHQHGLSGDEVRLLMRELLDGGIPLPPVLRSLAAPAQTPSPAVVQPLSGNNAVGQLDGSETLDITRISLADVFPTAVSVSRDPAKIPVATASVNVPELDDAESDSDHAPDPDLALEVDPDLELEPDIDLLALYRNQARQFDLLTAAEEVELAVCIEAGVLARERLENEDLPLERRRELRTLVAAGDRAYQRFASANVRLVIAVALHHTGRGLDQMDLIQEGNLGLLRAIQKWDFRQGTKFSTYATWWIRQSVTRGIADQTRTIRYPVHVVEKLAQMDEAEFRSLPTTLPLSDVLAGIGEDTLFDIADRYLGTRAPALRGLQPEDMHRVLSQRTEREIGILKRRFGFIGEPATLDIIGQELGVTRERVRQIESKALEKLEVALRLQLRSVSHAADAE